MAGLSRSLEQVQCHFMHFYGSDTGCNTLGIANKIRVGKRVGRIDTRETRESRDFLFFGVLSNLVGVNLYWQSNYLSLNTSFSISLANTKMPPIHVEVRLRNASTEEYVSRVEIEDEVYTYLKNSHRDPVNNGQSIELSRLIRHAYQI